MRKFLTVIFVVGVALQSQAAEVTSWSDLPDRVNTSVLIQDDRFVPFPWSVQKPFPWSFMEGTWLAQNKSFESYFTFRIISNNENSRRLEIRQVDLVTCKTVASGQGLTNKSNKTVAAFMEYMAFRQSYGLMLRSFGYGGPIRDIDVRPIQGQVVILSIKPEERNEYVHMALTKISSDARVAFCRENKLDSKGEAKSK